MRALLISFIFVLNLNYLLAATPIFTDTFDAVNPSWRIHDGNYIVTNGVARVSSPYRATGYFYIPITVTNGSIQARIRFASAGWAIGLGGRLNGSTGANYSLWIYYYGLTTIEEYSAWEVWYEHARKSIPSPSTAWHNVEMIFTNNVISAYYDGTLIGVINDSTYSFGYPFVVLHTTDGQPFNFEIDNFVVYSYDKLPKPKPITGITINWNAVLNANNYEVFASNDLISWTLYTNTLSTNLYCDINESAKFFKVRTIRSVNSNNVNVEWDPSPDSVVGYRVYYGTNSGNYYFTLNAYSNLFAIISNLMLGRTYYFAATAYDSNLLESIFSNEAIYSVPTTSTTMITNYVPINIIPIRQ